MYHISMDFVFLAFSNINFLFFFVLEIKRSAESDQKRRIILVGRNFGHLQNFGHFLPTKILAESNKMSFHALLIFIDVMIKR